MAPTLTRSGPYTLALKIEGIGNSDGQYRFAQRAAALDADSLYLPGTLVGWPSEIGASLDLRASTASLTQQTYRLRRTSDTLAHFWTLTADYVALAASAVGASGTTITLDATTLAGDVVFWEREAILLGAHAGAGVYTGCTRGYLGTQAQRHGDGDQPDMEVFASPVHTLPGRLVQLIRAPLTGGSYASEEVLWTGVLHAVAAPHAAEIALHARDLLALVQSTRIMVGALTWDAAGVTPSEQRAPFSGYGTDPSTAFTIAVETGSGTVALWPWRQTGSGPYLWAPFGWEPRIRDFPTILATGQPEDVEGWREVLSNVDEAPSNDASPGDNTLPLSQDPATLVLQLLTTTPNAGTPGENGDYDTGVDLVAGAIPVGAIDVDGILAWGSRYAGIRCDNLWLGLDGPEDLSDVIKRILQPLGAVLTLGTDGLLTVAQFADAVPYGDSTTIAQADVLDVGIAQERNLIDAVDRVQVTYKLIPGSGPSTTETFDARKSRRLPKGRRDVLTIDAGAYSDGPAISAWASALVVRYHLPIPSLVVRVHPSADHWPGQVLRLTHPLVLGDGVLGLTGGICLVMARREVLEGPLVGGLGERYIELSLAYVGTLYANQAPIGGSAQVSSWSAGTKTITCTNRTYTSALNPNLANDAAAFQAGDVVQIVDQYGTVVTATATVDSQSGNNIVLTAAPATPPASGDIVRHASYGSVVASQKTDSAFVANLVGEVGGSASNAYQYTTG